MKKTIKQNANKIMWVEYWVRKAHPSYEDYSLVATKVGDKWECAIELPLISKTVKSTSKTEVGAMLNVSEQASKLIDEYMKEHPEVRIKNRFKGKRWEIESDEDGRLTSIGMNEVWKQKQDMQIAKIKEESLKAIKKAINKIAKINGTSENLYIQVLDQSLFKNKDVEENAYKMNDIIEKEFESSNVMICSSKEKASIITIGYAFPTKRGGAK